MRPGGDVLTAGDAQPLGLIVRQAPYRQRSARAQLDVALAAAVLELPLEVYFFGDGVWQLAAHHDPALAALPSGLKGWAALPTMTTVRFFADDGLQCRLENGELEPQLAVEFLDAPAMRARWGRCSQVMAL